MPKLSNRRQAEMICLAALIVCLAVPRASVAQTVSRCGQAWLERVDGYPVLHLK
jgi:type II secretory pathway component PulK